MIIDMHCDTISYLRDLRNCGKEAFLRKNAGHVDLIRLQESGYLLQNFALFVYKGNGRNPWDEVCALNEIYQEELRANADLIAPVMRYEDIEKNRRNGKLSALLTVEEGASCEGDIKKLHCLYDWGVRMMTLTWNYPNELGWPNLCSENSGSLWQDIVELRKLGASAEGYMEQQKKIQASWDAYFHQENMEQGLTEKGREFVTEMEHLGMIVDVSHGSDALFYDVLETTRKPFVASHSNARAVCPCVRNLTDDMIRRLAERGGCCGLNFCADFLQEQPVGQENPGTIESVIRHARHIVDVGGYEVLGLGSDFDGIDTNRGITGAESMERLWQAFHQAGFSQSQLDRIFYQNVLRVYRECLV